MRTPSRIAILMNVVLLASNALAADMPNAAVPSAHRRTFDFIYAATVNGLTPHQPGRVWLPVPPSDDTQQVRQVTADLPAGASVAVEPRFGNRILSFALPAGHAATVRFSVTYHVARSEIITPMPTCPVAADAAMSNSAALLLPDTHVPVGGEPTGVMLDGKSLPDDPRLAARFLYDLVDDHLQYRKDTPGWGTGDAVWACHSGFGNCTDFHSLFISLARTEKLPAVFEIGFPVGETTGNVAGYHCWAWVKLSDGWSPVDIAEASQHPDKRDYYFGHLDVNRVAFSTGRDLELAPKQSGPPVNFFIYPYVEEGGTIVPQERIVKAVKSVTNR